ncbi:MAG: cofactor-independent phosphoglycerate mutase [Clostridia bacterium]|nr:cofactor-independent phosphoglycerate mutase [Clostridia bacterium]
MKYLVLVYDGAADLPGATPGGRTPLAAADKPVLDGLAARAEIGTVLNVPAGMVPESDTANLSILSYDPRLYSHGRSPLEALSMGLTMREEDVAYRANLVALSDGPTYAERVMLDHSSGEITTEEARKLIEALKAEFDTGSIRFFCGISYRHCMLWDGGDPAVDFARPHDIIGRAIGPYLPRGAAGAPFRSMMERSADILRDHPVNRARRERGQLSADSLWFWSPGKAPALPAFADKWGLRGTVVCAVDLIRGIGLAAGMDVPHVPGATGTVDTDYDAKAACAVRAFEGGADFVFVHIEGPDECGHHADAAGKVRCIEEANRRLLAPLVSYLEGRGEGYRLLLLPDHPTPVSVRTHTSDPVPYLLYRSDRPGTGVGRFDEESASGTDHFVGPGTGLLSRLFA